MSVRSVTLEDAPAIAMVHVESWRAAYRGLVPDAHLDALDPDRSSGWVAQATDHIDGPLRIYVFDDDTDVAGFVFVGPCRDDDVGAYTGEVLSLYVRPGRWRGGVGSRLLAAAEDDLRDHGCVEATLWVLERNAIGRAFYERSGWHPDGRTKSIEIGGASLTEARYRRRL